MKYFAACFALVAIVSSGNAAAEETYETVRGINLLRHQYTNWEEWDQTLTSAMANVAVTDCVIYSQNSFTDNPTVTISTWQSATSGAGNFFVFSHGHGDGAFAGAPGVMAEIYVTAAACNARYLELIGDGYVVVQGAPPSGGHSIYVQAAEMPSVLGTAGLSGDPVVLGMYCNSNSTYDRWKTGGNQAAFLGYSSTRTIDGVVEDAVKSLKGLGCFRTLDFVWFTFKETAGQAAGISDLILAAGNSESTLNYNKGCKKVTPHFIEAGMCDGRAYWTVSPNSDVVGYEIRGYNDPGARPVILERVEGRPNRLDEWCQYYDVPVSAGGYRYFDIREYNIYGVGTQSEIFRGGVARPEWHSSQLPEYGKIRRAGNGAEGIVMQVGSNEKSGGFIEAVVYSNYVTPSIAQPVIGHLTDAGVNFAAYTGVGTAMGVRYAYQTVTENNAQNGFFEPALLIVVGARPFDSEDRLGVCVDSWEFESTVANPGGSSCYSDLLLTDFDGDNVPNGPVTRVAAINYYDAVQIVNTARAYNASERMSNERRVAIFADDFVSWEGQTFAEPSVVAAIDKIEAACIDVGLSPVRVGSFDYPYSTLDERYAVCRTEVSAGLVEFWGMGLYSTEDVWVNFWKRELENTLPDQVFAAWIPSCWGTRCVGLRYGDGSIGMNGLWPYLTEQESSGHTQCAALVSSFNNLYEGYHEYMAEYLVDARRSAMPGTPIANVVYNAVRQMVQDRPELWEIAVSYGVYGGYVVLPNYKFGVVSGSTNAWYEIVPQSALADWTFYWETDCSTSPDLDLVEIIVEDMDAACCPAISVITPTTPSVDHAVDPLGDGTYSHTMVWRDRPCTVGCEVRYRVESGIGDLKARSTERMFAVSVCGKKYTPQEQ